jgi:hypothetical protein
MFCLCCNISTRSHKAGIAQLGERQTEDLKVACSIHAHRIRCILSRTITILYLIEQFLTLYFLGMMPPLVWGFPYKMHNTYRSTIAHSSKNNSKNKINVKNIKF